MGVSSTVSNLTYWLNNSTSGTVSLGDRQNAAVSGTSLLSLATVDFNADGKPDIVVLGNTDFITSSGPDANFATNRNTGKPAYISFAAKVKNGAGRPDVVDSLGMLQVDFPLKEAMGSSARFPLLTPRGLIRSRKERAAMHQVRISDGGIFENTVIQTMQSIARML